MSKKKVRTLLVYCFTILAVLLMGISTTLAVLKDVNNKEDNDIKFGKVSIASHSEAEGGSSLELKLLNDTVTRNSEIINVSEDIFESNFYFNIGANSEDMFVRFKIFFTFGSEEVDSREEESQVLALLNVGNGIPVGMDLHHYVEGDTEKGLLDYEYVQHEGWYYVATTENIENDSADRYLKAVTQENGHYTISRKYILTYNEADEAQILRVVKDNKGIMLKVQVEAVQCEGLSQNIAQNPLGSQTNNDILISEAENLGSGYGVKIRRFVNAIRENNKEEIIPEPEPEEPELVKKSLADCTPAEIKQVGKLGTKNANNEWEVNGEVWFKIGDEKPISLLNGETLTLQIADFNHDVDENGNILPFTFITKELLKDNAKMNSTDTNAGGWSGSAMYTYLNQTVWSWIPEDWKEVITPVEKKTTAGNVSSAIVSSIDNLFILSYTEAGLSYDDQAAYHQEGSLYPIFTTNNTTRIKYKVGATSSFTWWLRTPGISFNFTFWNVNASGTTPNTYTASSSYGVCFAFCV